MRESSPLDPGYGGHIWLNKERSADAKQVLFPGRGPSSLFACVGHRGQYLLISPPQGRTIVRLGIPNQEEKPPFGKDLAGFVEPFPAGYRQSAHSQTGGGQR